jgi:CRISPR-associated protein Cas1
MAVLYLIEQNTILRKTSERLRLCKMRTPGQRKSGVTQGDVLLELPCADIEQVMLFGNVQVTTQALQEMLQHGIEFAIFSFSGQLLGKLTPPETKNIQLRIAQFEMYHQTGFCLELSKTIIRSKISSMLQLLRTHQSNHPGLFDPGEIQKLNKFLELAASADNLDSLRGYEGSGTALYFSLFGKMFKPPWQFTLRSRRPPQDPVNAVLSFGYVIVGAELQSLLDGVGLDPFLGFYHQVSYGRPGLALDLLEEFRHALVDRLALALFNLGKFSESDFYKPPPGGVYLSTSGKRKFFEGYEKLLGQFGSATDTAAQKTGGFRKIFQQQISQLTKTILKQAPYTPIN